MLQIFFAFKRKQIATDTCMLLQLAGAHAPAGRPEGAAGPVGQKRARRPQESGAQSPVAAVCFEKQADFILGPLQHIK